MSNTHKYIILFFLVLITSCTQKQPSETSKDLFYRYYYGERDGFKVWIVDGALLREKVFNEFIYGGNDERYPFVPVGEIWIDNSISVKEFETTLAHEINERNLMNKSGMTYYDAHDSSLAVELIMRNNYKLQSDNHELLLPYVLPIDYDSTQEIESLPERIKLKSIYCVPAGEREGIKIWIVDGYNVRRDIYPDFGFSGNDLAYMFIPQGEIWLDGDISCEEMEYSIVLELKERELMKKGLNYDDAYTQAVKITDSLRKANSNTIKSKQLIIPTVLFRDTGTGRTRKTE